MINEELYTPLYICEKSKQEVIFFCILIYQSLRHTYYQINILQIDKSNNQTIHIYFTHKNASLTGH